MNQDIIQEEMSLTQYLRLFQRYHRLVIGIVAVSILLTGLWSATRPKIFESCTSIVPLPLRELGNKEQISEIGNKEVTSENIVFSILVSRSMNEKIMKDLLLYQRWEMDKDTSGIEALKGRVKIRKEEGVITIFVKDEDPRLAADIANALVDNLRYFNHEMSLSLNIDLARIIDRAIPADQRLPRRTVAKVIIASALSFVAAMALAFGIEVYNIERRREK